MTWAAVRNFRTPRTQAAAAPELPCRMGEHAAQIAHEADRQGESEPTPRTAVRGARGPARRDAPHTQLCPMAKKTRSWLDQADEWQARSPRLPARTPNRAKLGGRGCTPSRSGSQTIGKEHSSCSRPRLSWLSHRLVCCAGCSAPASPSRGLMRASRVLEALHIDASGPPLGGRY